MSFVKISNVHLRNADIERKFKKQNNKTFFKQTKERSNFRNYLRVEIQKKWNDNIFLIFILVQKKIKLKKDEKIIIRDL
jgi:hypothetical protein